MIVSATLVIGGAEFASTMDDFMWQFRTGIACVLVSIIIAGCMELLIRYEHYRLRRKFNETIRKSEEMRKVFKNIEKAQRSGNSNRAIK